jgi:hypothetical protein
MGRMRGKKSCCTTPCLVLTFTTRWFCIPLLQNSLSEGESEGDEKLLEDALEESFSVLEEKEQEETAAPVFRQEQLVSPPKEPVKTFKVRTSHVSTLIPGSCILIPTTTRLLLVTFLNSLYQF